MEQIDNCDLIITADNGISSYEAAEICKQREIDLIITDHHTPSYPLPDAYTIINPKQKDDKFSFSEICGAEVAWYFMASINSFLKTNIDMKEFLEYLVLAIIADIMPLTHLNRTLVKMGLSRFKKSTKPFVIILKEKLNKNSFKSEDIAFLVAPLLNSAGRMSDADLAFKFLNSKNIETATKYFNKLNDINQKRKETEKEITHLCIKDNTPSNIVIAYGPFHEGVLGIVAAKLVNHFKLPAIVFNNEKEILKGSGRSLGDINLYELLENCQEYLVNFGGHKLACGVSIKKENIEKFRTKIDKEIEKLPKKSFYLEDNILGEIPLKECDFELLDILEQFEPFGEGNPKPTFKAKVKIKTIKNLKNNHFKLIVSQNEIIKEAIIFGYNGEFQEEMEIVFNVKENNFNGNRKIQLLLKHFT